MRGEISTATAELWPIVRAIASAQLRRERNVSFSSGDLVNDAILRLVRLVEHRVEVGHLIEDGAGRRVDAETVLIDLQGSVIVTGLLES